MKGYKLLFIGLFLMLVSISSVSALELPIDNSTLVYYLSFDDNTTNDDTAKWNATGTGITFAGGSACKLGSCANFSGGNYYLDFDTIDSVTEDENFSVTGWYYATSDVAYATMWAQYDGSTDNIILHRNNLADTVRNYIEGSPYVSSTDHMLEGRWYFYAAIINGSQLYVSNGTNWEVITHSKDIIGNPKTFIGKYGSAGGFGWWDGHMDEVALWDTNLQPDEIALLYNNGTGFNPLTAGGGGSPPVATDKNVSIISPDNNYHTNDDTPTITYKYFTSTSDTANCTLTLSSGSQWGTNFSVANNTLTGVTFNVSLSDNEYNYTVSCDDGTNVTNATNRLIVVDTVNPIGNISIANGSTQNDGFAINLSVTDLYVWGWGFNITAPNGSVMVSNSSTNLTGTVETHYQKINTNYWIDGVYQLLFEYADDHTDNKWRPNKVEYKNDRLKVDDFISVMPENFDVVDMNYTITDGKLSYSFTPDANAPALLSYEVECDSGLYYRDPADFPLQNYPAHFVCGRYFIDFVNDEGYPVTVDIVSYKQAIVYTQASSFNSIGGLNIVTENISFTFDGDWLLYGFQAHEIFSNNSVNVFSVNNTLDSDTTTNGTAYLMVNESDTYNVTINNSIGYYNYTDSIDMSSVSNPYNFPLYDAQLDILGYNYSGGNLGNMTINVTYGSEKKTYYSGNNSLRLNLTSGLNYTIYTTSLPDFTVNHHTNTRNIVVNQAGINDTNYTLFHDQSVFITFSDLISLNALNDVNVSLSGGTDYAYNLLNESTFQFGIDPDEYSLLIVKSNYASFLQTIQVGEGNLTNISAQMTSASDEVTFLIINTYGETVSGATVTITKQSDKSLVATGTTDFSGQIKFGLSDLIDYYVNVTANGYEDFYDTFSVIDTSYTITLQFDDPEIDLYSGISYEFGKLFTPLNNGTMYNFSLNVSSEQEWDITGSWFYLYNESNLLTTNASWSSTSGGFVAREFNTSIGYNSITAVGTLELNSTYNITFYRVYGVANVYEGDFSLRSLLRSISNFNQAGFNGFARMFIAIMIIIGITVGVGSSTQLLVSGDGERVLMLITALVGFFSYIDWLNLPATNSPIGDQYFLFIILLVITVVMIINKEVSK